MSLKALVHSFTARPILRSLSKVTEPGVLKVWCSDCAGCSLLDCGIKTPHKLFLVRDRLGVKPLIYTSIPDNGVAFASTVRALKSVGLVGHIDEQAVVDYLEFGYVPDDRVIYRGAMKVPAGAIVEWSPMSGVRTYNYWTPPAVEDTTISFEEAVLETERLFLKAVEKRLFADVPVGSLLSGGVDSSLVCWAIAKLGGDITAFTVGDSWG